MIVYENNWPSLEHYALCYTALPSGGQMGGSLVPESIFPTDFYTAQ